MVAACVLTIHLYSSLQALLRVWQACQWPTHSTLCAHDCKPKAAQEGISSWVCYMCTCRAWVCYMYSCHDGDPCAPLVGCIIRQVLYSGVIDCLRKTLEADGFRGLYRGLGPNMLKAVPAMGISYAGKKQLALAIGVQINNAH